MKKNKPFGELFYRSLKKTLLTMRIAVILMILGILPARANDAYSQKTMLSLNFSETPLVKVLDKIENESEFFFLYNEKLLDTERKVNITEKDQLIGVILDDLFKGTDVKYTIVDRKIILAPDYLTKVSQPQQNKVTGIVTDKNGPIPGANVVVTGTTLGAITDSDGKFSIEVPQGSKSLTFSFVGMIPQEITIGTLTQINVTMVESAIDLNEVVIVGYGTQKKVNLTGAVSAITSEKLSAVPSLNVSTLLYGNLPGLITTQRSGQPGADDVDLSIRGFGTSLIVVDGIAGRTFDRLDPSEIESITILKDATSCAVYGVSGGNGVILVKTKRGTVGKPIFSYNANYGVQHVTRYPSFVNAAEFAELKDEAAMNSGGILPYTKEQIDKFRLGTDPNYPNFDYYHYFVRDYTPESSQNISVKGGSEKIHYYFLLGQSSQDAMWKCRSGGDQNYKKYNFRTNIDAIISDNFDISIGIGGREENRDNLVQDTYLMSSWMQYQWPIFAPLTPDGKIRSTNYGLSAYLDRDLTGYDLTNLYSFQGDLTINYKIPGIKGLSAHATFAQDLYFQKEKLWQKQYGLYTYDITTQTSAQTGARDVNQLVMTDGQGYANKIQASLTYSRNFLKSHNVSALLLYEESENADNTFTGSRINYVVPIDQIFAGPDLNKNNSGTASDNGRQSLVGRLNYDYQGKYLLEYSFRDDGSAKFPPAKRWGYFSGISAGWRLSEENFIKNNFSSVDNLKLRFSYGKLGDDNTGNFQFLTGYNYPSTNYIMGSGITSMGMVETGLPNPNITWEVSHTLNIGLDISLWKRLLEVEADVFNRDRNGLLALRTTALPSTFGATLPYENLNSDNTKGFEIVVKHTNQIGDIKYSITSNVSFSKTENVHVEQREFTSQFDSWQNNQENRWQNRYFNYKAIGQFQSQEEINSSPIQDGKNNSSLTPGDIKYDDLNKDGVIDNNDMQPIGRGTIPEINYGLGLSVFWKNFSVNMNWQGSANFVIEEQHFMVQPFANDMNTYAYFMDRWHRADLFDPTSAWVPGKYPSTINDGKPNNKMFSSFWLKNATYLRLKSLGISYRINNEFLKRSGIQDLTVTLSGQNLLTITGLEYIDPETPTGRLSYYPEQKSYNVGINVTF